MITALSETSLTSLKEKTFFFFFYHKTRAPFKNSLQKSHKLIRLFNYALFSPSIAHLCQNRGKNKLAPSEEVLPHQSLQSHSFFSSLHTSPSLHNISSAFSACPFPFVPGIILRLEEQSLLFASSARSFFLCIFLQTNKLGCCLAVIISPLYR